MRFFNQQDKILKIIQTYKDDFENIRVLLTKFRNHRDKCLAHNDVITECKHLEEITSKDTPLILKVILYLI